jgi:hypothetical protein
MKKIRSETGRLLLRSAGNGLGDRQMDAIISTPDVALDNHRVLGWSKPLPASVPLIDTHRDTADGVGSVIGKCVPRMEGNKLCGRLTFAPAEVNERGELAYQLCLNGFVDSVSVSFVPIEWEYARDRSGGGMDISEARLLETSICAVGSDERAKIFARAVRRQIDGLSLTRSDRVALAEAIAYRVRRADHAPASSPYDRAVRATAIAARVAQEDAEASDNIRRRLLARP